MCKNVFTVQKEADSERAASEKENKGYEVQKINYVDEGFDTLASEMSADPKAILRLKPVNYYAIKINISWEKFIRLRIIRRTMCSFQIRV